MISKKQYKAEYEALKNAIHRCHNPAHIAYKNYGARGITVCDEWRHPVTGVQAFLSHIGPRPTPSDTLDRIDNNKGYEPGNVRWTDRKTQQNNRRPKSKNVTDYGWGTGLSKPSGTGQGYGRHHSSLLPFDGRTQTIADWAKELNIHSFTIRQRLERGLSPEEALSPNMGRGGARTRSNFIVEVRTDCDPDVQLVREVSKAIGVLTEAVEQFKGRLH